MEQDTIFELYQLISRGSENLSTRRQSIKLRKTGLMSCFSKSGFTKVAFDTRRIDQETEYNPRRGLQNYNRSEAFISEALEQKLVNFNKLRHVLDGLKSEYGREHEWQDSNARILLSTLNNGLRIGQQDEDFAVSQPAQGSLDYIEELLHVRYRLSFDDLTRLGSTDLRKIILSKDEELTRKGYKTEITRRDVATNNYDTLLDKLFSAHASIENPEIERTVTITIKDKLIK